MPEHYLLHHLPARAAETNPDDVALVSGDIRLSYQALVHAISRFAGALIGLDLGRGERVAVFLEKRVETVVACLGAAQAGAVFVPVNPILKAAQVSYILRDCGVRVLVTSRARLESLTDVLTQCNDLRHIVLIDEPGVPDDRLPAVHTWSDVMLSTVEPGHRVIDSDMVAILYTSGSTGQPKGVVLSHRNMVAGAHSVAAYLGNRRDDVLLAALPLSFDAGFSQLTTGFYAGARVVLLNYLLARDVLNAMVSEQVTGLTAVPPLYAQLAQLSWPESIQTHFRYFANTGGRMPVELLNRLRAHWPKACPYLMYGLTEAFRSTYLPPEQVDQRPESIGKAIPNAEVLVLRADGSACAPNEPGELVHRGALVAMGYWNDPEKTEQRFRPLPSVARPSGLVLPEIAVFSGDTVRMDEEGYLYFIGRRDEMIKTSGYRVSPTEVEEVVYRHEEVAECAAFGVPHATLGAVIVIAVMPRAHVRFNVDALMNMLKTQLPAYMVPTQVVIRTEGLPRNPNGKIDRKLLSSEFESLFIESSIG